VLTLHNFRLFCAIGVAFRDGEPCFRCRRGLTLPGVALNCRGSLPEAAVYATALARQLPKVLAVVDLFTTPSEYSRGQLIRLGVPEDRIRVLRHYVPSEELAESSRAGDGQFALFAGRLSEEKGVVQAIEACVNAGVPILVAGEGPLEPQLREFASRTRAGVELLGRLESAELAELRSRAAMLLLPSIWDEIAPYAALEAMAAGVPVVATRTGGLPEMVGEERCVPRGDPAALRQAVSALWEDPEERRRAGGSLLERVRSEYSEERWLRELLAIYR
jgi:glycosyltransferase involved in cell wall biosynthesis